MVLVVLVLEVVDLGYTLVAVLVVGVLVCMG
jgi:hypothetical protein